MVDKTEQGDLISERYMPRELALAVRKHPIVAWCWTCMQLLYTPDKKDATTMRVSMDTQQGHFDSFSKEHNVAEFGTGYQQ
jgi:hypothetical protein